MNTTCYTVQRLGLCSVITDNEVLQMKEHIKVTEIQPNCSKFLSRKDRKEPEKQRTQDVRKATKRLKDSK